MNRTTAGYAVRRDAMVECQLRLRGIRDPRVLAAFLEVPREEFVLPQHVDQAYEDCPLPIGEGQTISQPYMVGVMTEALALAGAETVLEVGTGSGYQAALLARLARRVYTIESHAALSAAAQERLERLGCANATCLVGDGSLGYPPAAPYDAIIVTAAAPRVPPPLTEQLAEGGRLVLPVGNLESQELLLVRNESGRLTQKLVNYCRFVPLTGQYGWSG